MVGAAGWRSGAVPVSGGVLAYHRTGGDLPPLVLAHGLTDNGLCWRRLAQALEPAFDVIMLDARGHGASTRIAANGRHEPADDLAEAIEALGLEAPVVMGHSVGARAAAAYAGSPASRASKVVLEDPVFLPLARDAGASQTRAQRFRNEVARFQAMTEAEIAAEGAQTYPGWHVDDLPDWAAAKRQVDPAALPVYAVPWQQQIAHIRVPTLVIGGEPDLGSLVTPAVAAEAMALNANIRTVRIAGAGHNIRRENFRDYLKAVQAFVRA